MIDMEDDERIFKSLVERPCFRCGTQTKYIAHGLHVYICSPKCLSEHVDDHLKRTRLDLWASPIPDIT